MKIVADKAIFQVEDYFAGLGELLLLPGRDITSEHVFDADALLVRTITRIDPNLVRHSSLRFVGSATSGTDHVDVDFLHQQGIHFSHAPGCNADAVVDYVFAALAWLAGQGHGDWSGKTAGVIGAGHVGGRLAQKMRALGMKVNVYDPFLAASHPLASCFANLDDVLAQDIVSLHVPLTLAGPHPTFHMLDSKRLSGLGKASILVNACRGEVVDNPGLYDVLEGRQDIAVVMDVWEGEPGISARLAENVAVATPHIAGYSLNGKRNATLAIARAFSEFFGLENDPKRDSDTPCMLALPGSLGEIDALNAALLQAYPIQQDFLVRSDNNLAAEFDRRRNGYTFRKEFSDFAFLAGTVATSLGDKLACLGFRPM